MAMTFRELLSGAAGAASHRLSAINESGYQVAWISTEDWHFECPVCRRRTPFSEEDCQLFCGHCFTHCSIDGGVEAIPEEFSFLAPLNATHFCGVVTVKPPKLLSGMAGNILGSGCVCWYPAAGTADVLLDQDHMNLAVGRVRERIEDGIRKKSPAIKHIEWITVGRTAVGTSKDIEHEAFEKWAGSEMKDFAGGIDVFRDMTGGGWSYATKAAEAAWRSWLKQQETIDVLRARIKELEGGQ